MSSSRGNERVFEEFVEHYSYVSDLKDSNLTITCHILTAVLASVAKKMMPFSLKLGHNEMER